jgi:hypothetical protein
MSKDLLIYTIGHSDHETATFIDLLHRHRIAFLRIVVVE